MKQKNPLSHEARELALFIENDGDLYRQQTTPIILNLARKIKRGIFSHVKAAKLFRYLADNGAKKYSAEFGTPQAGVTRASWQRYKGFDAFSTKARQETAKHLLRYYFQAIREKAGELGAKKNPVMHGPRKVRFTAQEVRIFRRQFPASGLQDRSYWFEFDADGNLIDTDVPEHNDGPGASALADDAKKYAFEDVEPEFLL